MPGASTSQGFQAEVGGEGPSCYLPRETTIIKPVVVSG